jgi:hypothetical protein
VKYFQFLLTPTEDVFGSLYLNLELWFRCDGLATGILPLIASMPQWRRKSSYPRCLGCLSHLSIHPQRAFAH